MKKSEVVLGLIRIGMGLIFLWAFLDKLFGLGLATVKENAWVLGGSPTFGFLNNVSGVFQLFFKSLAGNPVVDYIFMIGLLLIGVVLIFGIGMKIASYSGALMFFLMWLAVFPLKNHPFLNDHLIYALILILLPMVKAGYYIGFGKKWSKIKFVKKFRFLE